MKKPFYCKLFLTISLVISTGIIVHAQSADFETIKKSGLPIIHINVNNDEQIVSKYEYLKGVIRVYPNTPGNNTIYSDSLEIKGRGNSTFGFPKRPFRIKLKKAAALLGMPDNRHWALMANFEDKSLSRTKLAMDISSYFNMPYTPKTKAVELVTGSYHWGTYELIEVPKIGTNRINIEGINSKGGSTKGGVLYEFDSYLDETYTFYTAIGKMPFVIKDPDDLNTSDPIVANNHFQYARKILQDAENALYAVNFKDQKNGYPRYFDVESLVNWYLIQELTKNIDLYKSSVYMYNNTKNNNKITFSPAWDFDFSMGNLEDAGGMRALDFPWITRLLEDPAFLDLVKKRYREKRNGLEAYLFRSINLHNRHIYGSQKVNFSIWNPGHYSGFFKEWYPGFIDRNNFTEEVFHIKQWLLERIKWMDETYLDGATPAIGNATADLRLTIKEDASIDSIIRMFSPVNTKGVLQLAGKPKMGIIKNGNEQVPFSFTYIPDKNKFGTDSIYLVPLINGYACDTSLVIIDITPENDAPTLRDSTIKILEDESLTSSVVKIMSANTIDPDDDEFSFSIERWPLHGKLSITQKNDFEYIPDPDFFGIDTIVYRAIDKAGASSSPAYLFIVVQSVDDPPVFSRVRMDGDEDKPILKTPAFLKKYVFDVDDTSFTFRLLPSSIKGQLEISKEGFMSYVPKKDFYGQETANIMVSDPSGATDTTILLLSIYPINDTPILNTILVKTYEDNSLKIDYKTGIYPSIMDVDDNDFEIEWVGSPKHGSISISPKSHIVYTPIRYYFGSDTLYLKATDTSKATSNIAPLIIQVIPVNNPPEYPEDTLFAQVRNGETLQLDQYIAWNKVFDADNDIASISIKTLSKPKLGNILADMNKKLYYTPYSNTLGIDGFEIALFDGTDLSKKINFVVRVLAEKGNVSDGSIKIYPNPSKGNFTIDFIEIDKYQLLNYKGSTIVSGKYQSPIRKLALNLSGLAKGTYLLYLYNKNQLVGIKRIVLY